MKKANSVRKIFALCVLPVVLLVGVLSMFRVLAVAEPQHTTTKIESWAEYYDASLQNLKSNCKMKYIQISEAPGPPTPDNPIPQSTMSLEPLDLTDEQVRAMAQELSEGSFSIEDHRVYRVAEVYYSQGKFKYVSKIFSKEAPGGFSVLVSDNSGPVWLYYEIKDDMHRDHKALVLGVDLDRALFTALTPDMFLQDYMFWSCGEEDKFIHIQYKDLIMIADEKTIQETGNAICFDTKCFSYDLDGQIILNDESTKQRVAFEIDKSSGLILKSSWFNYTGDHASDLFITKTKSIGDITVPARMYNEMVRPDGSIFTRNLFLVYDASTEPISNDEFEMSKIVPAGVPMYDNELQLGNLTYQP